MCPQPLRRISDFCVRNNCTSGNNIDYFTSVDRYDVIAFDTIIYP
jgi:hypothetical protein